MVNIWETNEEEQEAIIKKMFGWITRYDMDIPAVMLLESIKPLAQVGGALAQMAIGPVFLAFWERGFDYIHTFEEMNNIEKLIKMIEDKHEKERTEKAEKQKHNKVQPHSQKENVGLIEKVKRFFK
jgi:hypothetical protein